MVVPVSFLFRVATVVRLWFMVIPILFWLIVVRVLFWLRVVRVLLCFRIFPARLWLNAFPVLSVLLQGGFSFVSVQANSASITRGRSDLLAHAVVSIQTPSPSMLC